MKMNIHEFANKYFPGGGWWTGEAILPMTPDKDHGALAWAWVRENQAKAEKLGFSRKMNPAECRAHGIKIGWVRFRLHNDPRDWKNDRIRCSESFNCDVIGNVSLLVKALIEMKAIHPDALSFVGNHKEELLFKGRAKELISSSGDFVIRTF